MQKIDKWDYSKLKNFFTWSHDNCSPSSPAFLRPEMLGGRGLHSGIWLFCPPYPPPPTPHPGQEHFKDCKSYGSGPPLPALSTSVFVCGTKNSGLGVDSRRRRKIGRQLSRFPKTKEGPLNQLALWNWGVLGSSGLIPWWPQAQYKAGSLVLEGCPLFLTHSGKCYTVICQ